MKKIIVFQQHTHDGVTYPAGSEITLPDADANWLLEAEGARRAEIIKEAKKSKELLKSLESK